MSKESRPHAPKIPPQARLLFSMLEHQYADADEQEWDELRSHLDSQVARLAAGNPDRERILVAEFDNARSRVFTKRRTAALLDALADGQGELQCVRDDGLEEWLVKAGNERARFLLPGEDPEDRRVSIARDALLTGLCPRCKRRPELVDGTLETRHAKRCPARSRQD